MNIQPLVVLSYKKIVKVYIEIFVFNGVTLRKEIPTVATVSVTG